MEEYYLIDLSGEEPVIRILFFLFVVSVIIGGFLLVIKFGRKEDIYIHPLLKRIIEILTRR
ncbi:MAG: hypothetical protein JXA44_01065 [Methanospirillaceae archaeon]|nr:hypothetical protein [Methanospirillaceae archaeon]